MFKKEGKSHWWQNNHQSDGKRSNTNFCMISERHKLTMAHKGRETKDDKCLQIVEKSHKTQNGWNRH